MKKLLIALLIALCLLSLAACGKSRIVHCDGCGKEIKVSANSNMTEDWIILCSECQAKADAGA